MITRDMVTGAVRTVMQALWGLIVSWLLTIPLIEETGIFDSLNDEVVVGAAVTVSVAAVYWLVGLLSSRVPWIQRLFILEATPTYDGGR